MTSEDDPTSTSPSAAAVAVGRNGNYGVLRWNKEWE